MPLPLTSLPTTLLATLLAAPLAALLLAGLAGAPATAATPTQAQAQETRADARAAASDYRLGAGDLLRIAVYQNPDLSLETRVGEAGRISFPLVGSLPVGGLALPQAEARLAEALRDGGYVRQPQVTITVLQVRGHQATVMGLVNRPGRFALESTRTRLTELLAMAGGPSAGAADVVVLVGQRDGAPWRTEVDLAALFGPGGQARDHEVRHGDVLWVARQPQVYIYGEVQRPGVLRLERGMTVLQALASGGGLTPRGTERGIRVHRKAADGAIQALSAQMADTLQDGDVVHVRESLF